MKALGTGHAFGVVWRDVEVVRFAGPPRIELHGAAAERFARMGGVSAHLTLTHTGDLALAHVILVG
jgi:holo-[acyl-carrier protein] synthase